MPNPGETRQKILQLSQLNLQSTFAAAGALRKDIENQLRSIEYLAREQILQVTALRRRKLIVKNHRGHLLILTRILDQLCLAATDVIRSRRFRQLLRDCIDDFGARGARQFAQFFEHAVFKHCFYSLIDAGIKLFSIAKNEDTWSRFAVRSATRTCHDTRAPRLAERGGYRPLVTLRGRWFPGE